MFDDIGQPLFAALAKAVAVELSEADPCAQACLRAAGSGARADVLVAQASLMKLSENVRQAVMAEAHRLLREDMMRFFGDPIDVDRSRILH
jgi:hypothetical protein